MIFPTVMTLDRWSIMRLSIALPHHNQEKQNEWQKSMSNLQLPQPLCPDAWGILPTPLMLTNGNDYLTCSVCGQRVDAVITRSAQPGGKA